MKVLVVEDEAEVTEAITLCLTVPWPGLVLIATASGEEAVVLAKWFKPDVVLLDLALSDAYGLHVLKEIREFSDMPVVIVTANGEETSRVQSHQLGSDDYLVKPFSHIELLGSIRAALSRPHRSSAESPASPFQFTSLVIDLPGRRVIRNGQEVDLTSLEWRLLITLLQGQGEVVPYSTLGDGREGEENITRSAAEKAFRSLSSKLSDDAGVVGPVQSHGKEGYRFALTPP